MLRQLGLVRLDNSVDPGWRVLDVALNWPCFITSSENDVMLLYP